jgi:hypothetical protein
MSELRYKIGDTVITHDKSRYRITRILLQDINFSARHIPSGKEYIIGIDTIDHNATAKFNQYKLKPKEMLEDGFKVETRTGRVLYYFKKLDIFIPECHVENQSYRVMEFTSDLSYDIDNRCNKDILKVYNSQDKLIWERTEKLAQQIEIERIEATMRDCADRLSKLKGDI